MVGLKGEKARLLECVLQLYFHRASPCSPVLPMCFLVLRPYSFVLPLCFPVLHCTSLCSPVLPLYSAALPVLRLYSPVLREYGSLAFFPWLDFNIIEKIDLIYIRKKFLNVKYN